MRTSETHNTHQRMKHDLSIEIPIETWDNCRPAWKKISSMPFDDKRNPMRYLFGCVFLVVMHQMQNGLLTPDFLPNHVKVSTLTLKEFYRISPIQRRTLFIIHSATRNDWTLCKNRIC